MGEVKGQGLIVHPVSNQCTSFWFHINRTNHSWDMSNKVFDLEKIHPKFGKKKGFQQNCSKISSGDDHDQRNIATKFGSDWLIGSYFILHTTKFLFINVTAMALGQGHPKVTQYILPDPYFLCPKYLRSNSNGFDVRSKSHCGGGGHGRGRGGGNELKT